MSKSTKYHNPYGAIRALANGWQFDAIVEQLAMNPTKKLEWTIAIGGAMAALTESQKRDRLSLELEKLDAWVDLQAIASAEVAVPQG